MNKTKFTAPLGTLILCIALLTACNNDAGTAATSEAASQTAAQSTGQTTEQTADESSAAASLVQADDLRELVTYEEDDLNADWSESDSTMILLPSGGISGSGAAEQDGVITISEAGTYVLSGSMDDGQVIVDVKDKGTVRLVLNGAELNSSDSAPIYVKQAGKTVITLADGTVNTVTDGKEYVYGNDAADEPSAAIYSKDDLTINGTGKLTVYGNYNDGIAGRDDLKIVSGTIHVQAADDGIVGRDMIAVQKADVTIDADGDGMKSTNDTEAEKGFIEIEDGTFQITAGSDGVQAATNLQIDGGQFDIVAGGGSANAAVKAEQNPRGRWGQGDAAADSSPEGTNTGSAKGLKSAGNMTLNAGSFTIDSADDAIHSNSILVIADGQYDMKTGDDGIHADTSITVSGGSIAIAKSYEGIESSDITITGGDIDVTASDDGINISGGNDGSSLGGRPGQNGFASNEGGKLTIQGGYVTVNASGDGLDANGSIYMTGGTVLVNGPTSNGNGAVDYDGTFEISGGLLVAAGSSGMVQSTTDGSSSHSILMTYSQTKKAGTLVQLQDSSGNTIVAFAPEKDYQSILISSPELKEGEKYTLYSGGSSTGTENNGLYMDGTVSESTKVVSFDITGMVTWLNESGVTEGNSGGGFGGGGQGRGGMKPGGKGGTMPDGMPPEMMEQMPEGTQG